MEKKMNRRDLLKSMAILPLPFSRKLQLDRVTSITMLDRDNKPIVGFSAAEGYFDVKSLKESLKRSDYHVAILKDGNSNTLKVNKLNKGLVLLKLEMMK